MKTELFFKNGKQKKKYMLCEKTRKQLVLQALNELTNIENKLRNKENE